MASRSLKRSDDAGALTHAALASGLPARRIPDFVREGRLTERDVLSVLPRRTYQRRLARDEPLRLHEADALARLIRVRDHARAAFDTPQQVELWLTQPNPALGGAIPIEMARTDIGAREVEAVLTRFEHGVFS